MRKHISWIWILMAATLYGQSVTSGHPAPATSEAAGQVTTTDRAQAPTKGAPAARAATKTKPNIKFGPLQSSPQILNSSAAGATGAIIAVLQKQRRAADAEAAQMKLGIRPQAKATATTTGRSASNSVTLQKTTPGTIGPEKTMDSSGKVSPTVQQFSGAALVCAQDPTMRILTVSGESYPATFTSDDQYNFYTIVGCSFADPGPTSKVYVYYQNTFHQDFQIQEWNENGIKLSLKPNLTGLLDHDNLTLVVQRADGKQATKAGFKFYAARETKSLKYFPRNQFALWQFTMNDTSHLAPTYQSPSQVPQYAAEVLWQCNNCLAKKGQFNNVYMQGNEDVWKLENLQPGFVVQSYGMGHRNLDCESMGYQLHTEGAFGIKMEGTELHAQWQGQMCVFDGCGGAFQTDCFGPDTGADYLIHVMVSGPRGVDPWTGKPL
jgi:hypothetical protein